MNESLETYWLVTTEMYPFSGGIGVYAHHSARMLAQGGIGVTVFFHDPTVQAPTVQRRDGYRLITFSTRTLLGRRTDHGELHGPLGVAYQTCGFLKEMLGEEGAPDLVEFQDYGALAYFFLKHRLMEMDGSAPRVVLTAHRPYVHCAATDDDSVFEHTTAFLGDAERWCYAAADAVLAPSRFIVDALQRPDMAFPLRAVDVVANPFDPEIIVQAPDDALTAPQQAELNELRHGPDEPVLYFGKLQNQKGAWDCVASLAALWAQGRSHPLWMWGRDAFHAPSGTTTYDFLEGRYRRLFARGLVRYFGDYALGTVRALCADHPICVLPYREECLPYAFFEVVLCGGIPLVAKTGGQIELLPQACRDRLTVDFNRPDALGDKLDGLKALSGPERRTLSDALRAEVLAITSYARVLPAKLEALGRVSVSVSRDYPFAYDGAKIFPPLDPQARRNLADAVPQRGATVSTVITPEGSTARGGPLMSVVIPYYEMHDYIDATLESVEAQAHDHVEIIIVDDGSHTEAAKAKLNAIAARPARFRTTIVRKYNGGLADARNAGAKVAQGEYLYFLDADDLIHPATLSKGLAVLSRFDNVAYVGAWLREFEGGDREWLVWDIDGPYVGFHNLQICSFLIRAEAWLRFGVNDPGMSLGMEDYESHVRMGSNGVRGVALPRSFFQYRIRKDSMSRAFNPHVQAFLQRRTIANNRAFYDRHGGQLAAMFAENGHGALATPPTVRTAANKAMFGVDIPSLQEIDDGLELNASRERLSRALRARAHHGGAAWDYTVARLLLALDIQAEFAQRCLLAATTQAPDNGWYRLYAIVARLRAGHDQAAQALWSKGFDAFCEHENGAVLWVAGLESVRGYPAVNTFFQSRLNSWQGGGDMLVDPRFIAIRRALAVVAETKSGAQALALEAVKGFHAAAADLVSSQAATAMLNRWLTNWTCAGVIDATAPRHLAAAIATDRAVRQQVYHGLAGEAEWLDLLERGCAAAIRTRQEPAPIKPVRGLSRPLSLLRHKAPRK